MAKAESTRVSSPSTPKPPKAEEPKLNVAAFCKIKGYRRGIQSRLEIWMAEHHDAKSEKTLVDWEETYKKAMNRVTS